MLVSHKRDDGRSPGLQAGENGSMPTWAFRPGNALCKKESGFSP